MKFTKVITSFLASVLFATTPTVASVYAEETTKKKTLSMTSVVEDLQGIDLTDVFDTERTDCFLYSFQEFGFSRESGKDYNLYFYVANPQKYKFSTRDGSSVVNIATVHDTDGKAKSYINARLHFIGYYDVDGNDVNDYKIAKFCLASINERDVLYEEAKRLDESGQARQYDIAGIQLRKTDETREKVGLGDKTDTSETVKDYNVAKTYYCTGYANGYGTGSASTLTYKSKDLTTISLDVKHTNYRPDTAKHEYHDQFIYDDLQTAYFSVAEEYFEQYGDLQKIKCDYYHEITNPIFVITSDRNAYSALYPYVGKNLTEKDFSNLNWAVLFGLHAIYDGTEILEQGVSYAYPKYYVDQESPEASRINRIDYLFADYEDGKISREQVVEYMTWYTNQIGGTRKTVGKNYYSSNLFVDKDGHGYLMDFYKPYLELFNESEKVKLGHNTPEIDIGDTGKLTEKSNDFWTRLGFRTKVNETSYNPIEVLTSDDITFSTGKGLCEEYLWNEDDFDDIKSYGNKAFQNNERLVLFRFANTNYYESPAKFDYLGNWSSSDIDGYVAQESVFLQFDIISLTFRSDIVGETVIGAVSDPIDIINGVEEKTGEVEIGLKPKINLFAILMLIALVVLAFAIVKGIFKTKATEHAMTRALKKQEKRNKKQK